MLSKEIIESAISTTEILDKNKIMILARPNTELEKLNTLTTDPFLVPNNILTSKELNYQETIDKIITRVSIPSLADNRQSEHDIQLDLMVDGLSEIVNHHLNFTRNTVKPMISELAKQLTEALANVPETATYNPIVKKWDIPTPMLITTMVDSIEEFKDEPYLAQTLLCNFPKKSGIEVVELMKTGSKTVDGEIDSWVSVVGVDLFEKIYETVYTSSANQTTENLFSNRTIGTDAAFAVFLISKKLFDNPLQDTPYSLTENRKIHAELFKQAALRCSQAYQRRDTNLKLKLLLVNWDNQEVTVFKPVYDSWLEEKGNPAVLYGNLLSDRPVAFLPAMLAIEQQCINKWVQQNNLMTLNLKNKRFVTFKETLINVTQRFIIENMKTLFGELVDPNNLTVTTPAAQIGIKNVKDRIANLTIKDIENVYILSGELVAKHIFYYTDAYAILTCIEKAMEDNKNISVLEAALISTIEYVTDYVTSQLKLNEF